MSIPEITLVYSACGVRRNEARREMQLSNHVLSCYIQGRTLSTFHKLSRFRSLTLSHVSELSATHPFVGVQNAIPTGISSRSYTG